MRPFSNWLNEASPDDVEIPNRDKAARMMRADMPKLSDLAVFVSDLAKNGIGTDVRMIDPKSLKPGQQDFNMDKVREFQKTTNPTLDLPIVISRDDYVVDGHHRWIAAVQNNVPILAHNVDMDFYDIIKFLNELQYPTNQSVG